MGTIEALSLAMGTAWTSGINLYATVAALGIARQMELIELPQNLEVLAHPAVIAIACIMYLIEFFADKVPYLDSGWDALHTFIRVPAGALLAARALGDMSPALELAAMLAGGSIALAAHALPCRLRVLGNLDVLAGRAQQLRQNIRFAEIGEDDATPAQLPGSLAVQSFPLAAPVTAGTLDARNSAHVLALLDAALRGCMQGNFGAIVTGPVHKGVINDCRDSLQRPTEYLAEKSGTDKVVMMLAGGGLRGALATTHLPLAAVSAAITPASLTTTVQILIHDLRVRFGMSTLPCGRPPCSQRGSRSSCSCCWRDCRRR